MDLHEYQTKILLKEYRLPIPQGAVIRNINETTDAIAYIGGKEWVLKAQIHAVDRSKSGGIRIVADEEELYTTIKTMMGSRLVTPLNAPNGQPVNQILIENRVKDIAREIQVTLSINHDTAYTELTLISEDTAALNACKVNHEHVYQVSINPVTGLQYYQCYDLFVNLKLELKQQVEFFNLLTNLYQLFSEKDLTFFMLNPLAITTSGDFICIDAKSTVDDCALFRQPGMRHMRDITQENHRIIRAKQCGFEFTQFKGPIACLVNGYGAVLATSDLLEEKNIHPASFLDLQSNIDASSIVEAFRIILEERNTKVILINICTRLSDCYSVIEGIIAAIAELHFNLPIIISLQGYNAKDALKKLTQNNLGISVVSNFANAVNHFNQYAYHETMSCAH
jgi:succinyl-CoA synthetase beta subunit